MNFNWGGKENWENCSLDVSLKSCDWERETGNIKKERNSNVVVSVLAEKKNAVNTRFSALEIFFNHTKVQFLNWFIFRVHVGSTMDVLNNPQELRREIKNNFWLNIKDIFG